MMCKWRKRTNPEPDFACASLAHAIEPPGVRLPIRHNNHCMELSARPKHALTLVLHPWHDARHVALSSVSKAQLKLLHTTTWII